MADVQGVLESEGIDKGVTDYVASLFAHDPKAALAQAGDILGPWASNLPELLAKLSMVVSGDKAMKGAGQGEEAVKGEEGEEGEEVAVKGVADKEEALQRSAKPPPPPLEKVETVVSDEVKEKFLAASAAGDIASVHSMLTEYAECTDCLMAAEDKYGETAMRLSVRWNKLDLVKVFLALPATSTIIESKNKGYTALLIAAAQGFDAMLDLLLNCDPPASISAINDDKNTAYHLTARGFHADAFNLLMNKLNSCGLDRGQAVALLNSVNCHSETALHLWAAHGQQKCIERLMKIKGVDPSLQDRDGNTAALSAALEKHEDAAVHILQKGKGRGVELQNSLGLTVLHVAASSGLQKLAVCAIALGAPLDSCNEDFLGACTPLHIAASYGEEAIARFILARGADPSEKNGDGLTSVELAKMAGHESIAEKLKEAVGAQTQQT